MLKWMQQIEEMARRADSLKKEEMTRQADSLKKMTKTIFRGCAAARMAAQPKNVHSIYL